MISEIFKGFPWGFIRVPWRSRDVPGEITGAFQQFSRGFRRVPEGFMGIQGCSKGIPLDFRSIPGFSKVVRGTSKGF